MADEFTVKGLSELQRLLDELPAKMERNVLRGAMRAGSKPVLADAKNNVSVKSGTLRDGLKIKTSARGGTVKGKVVATGDHAYVAPWVEFGTNPHIIPGPLKLVSGWIKDAEHPGARAKPFMRPALDRQKTRAVVAAGEYIKQGLQNKHGLDLSHLEIEGDE